MDFFEDGGGPAFPPMYVISNRRNVEFPVMYIPRDQPTFFGAWSVLIAILYVAITEIQHMNACFNGR